MERACLMGITGQARRAAPWRWDQFLPLKVPRLVLLGHFRANHPGIGPLISNYHVT